MEREDGVDCGWGWWVQEVNGQDEWVVDIDDVEIEQGLRGRDVRKVGVSVDYGFKFG